LCFLGEEIFSPSDGRTEETNEKGCGRREQKKNENLEKNTREFSAGDRGIPMMTVK